MKNFKTLNISLIIICCIWTLSWANDLEDFFKELQKPQQPASQNNQGDQQAPSTQNEPPKPATKTTPSTSKNESPLATPITPSKEQEEGQEGLLGILEQKGVLDKKTSRIIRGAGQVVQSMQPIAYEEERAIGGSLALEVLNRFGGVYPNPRLQKYITLVGQSVVSVSDRADIPYHFAVINSEIPNAFATPGGYVFVSIGLLKLLRNEAELAGVLGHEVAHITHRHALKTLERSKKLKGISSLSTAVMNEDPALFDNIINQVTEVLFTKGLDKELEFEADKVGMEYAYRVGYRPNGLREFLKILHHNTKHDSIFFSTHPSPRERYNKMSPHINQLDDAKFAPQLANRFGLWTKGQLR